MSSVVHKIQSNIGRSFDSVNKKLGVSSNNFIVDSLNPVGAVGSKLNDKPLTFGNWYGAVNDPGNALGKATKVQDRAANNAARAAAQLTIPSAPNQDTAANANQQNLDAMRRRRGVLANIFAGSNSSTLG